MLVLAQDGNHVVRIVLRADGEQNAALGEVQERFLEVDVLDARRCRAELDTLWANLADDTYPPRAVQVDHDAFASQALEGLHVAHRIARELPERHIAVPHASHVVELAVLLLGAARAGQHLAQRHEKGMSMRAQVFCQIAVNVLDPPEEAFTAPVVENAVWARACECEFVHDDERGGPGAELANEPRDAGAYLRPAARQLGDPGDPADGGEQILNIQRHEYDFGAESI